MKRLDQVRIGNDDKLNFLTGLSTMLRAGLSVLEVVDSLAEDAQGGLKIFLDGPNGRSSPREDDFILNV